MNGDDFNDDVREEEVENFNEDILDEGDLHEQEESDDLTEEEGEQPVRKKLSKKLLIAIVVGGLALLVGLFFILRPILFPPQEEPPIEVPEVIQSIVDRPRPRPERPEPVEVFPELLEAMEINQDAVAWVSIPNTPIHYPVLRSPFTDWDYYLNRDIHGNSDPNGIPYVWPHSEVATDDLAFLYGHNLPNGEVFSFLNQLRDPDLLAEHSMIDFHTRRGSATYEIALIFEVFVNPGVSQFFYHVESGRGREEPFTYTHVTNWESEEQFDTFVEHARQYELFPIDVDLNFGDRLIAFWTCTDSAHAGHRLVVVAVQRDSE